MLWLNAKLISVNSLEAMAQGMINFWENDALFCPMIDARRMEVYCLIADSELSIIEETQAKIIDDDSYSNLLSGHKIIFFGDGASKCKTALGPIKNAVFIENIHPSAENIGLLAWRAYQNNQFEDLAYFEPYYLKDFIAKKPLAKKMV